MTWLDYILFRDKPTTLNGAAVRGWFCAGVALCSELALTVGQHEWLLVALILFGIYIMFRNSWDAVTWP